jgi:hypothetical protein
MLGFLVVALEIRWARRVLSQLLSVILPEQQRELSYQTKTF